MAQGGSSGSGVSYGRAAARIDLDLSSLTSAATVARAAGDAAAKAIEQSLKIVQNEQKIALQQAQQATAAVRAQQAQITATTRAESAERVAAARSEAAQTQQQERAKTATIIEEQKRQTAAFKQELRERNRSQVNSASIRQNATGFVGAAFGGPIGGLVGAAASGNIGLAAGLAVNQGAQAAIDATQVATAYNRQEVAARSLAGSQGRLNELLGVYANVTGGAIDQATSLANVTKLMSVGFADNAGELGKFGTAIRGISVAMGQSQDMVTQNLILELFSQRGQRLDQLGLQYQKVKDAANQLRAADGSLTTQQAYQNAVLDQAIDRYGKLAKSKEGAATGLELAGKATANAKLEIGQVVSGPVNVGGLLAAGWIEQQIDLLHGWERAWDDLKAAAQRAFGVSVPTGMQQRFIASSASRDAARHGGAAAAPDSFTGDQQALLIDWNTKRVAVERSTQAAVVNEARSWANARLDAERSFTKQSVREAEDWSRQQSRTLEDFQESRAKNAKDYGKQQARQERDLGRSIAQVQADEADKVADIRKDGNKQLQRIEEDFASDQAKALRHFKNDQMDAAGDLDAKAVLRLQRDFAEQQQDAKEAHGKQVKDAKEQLQQRLDDEAESLAKSIIQQRKALAERQADQAADYAESNQNAQEQFDKEQARAGQDREIRLGRMAQDQQDQLDSLDRAHGKRMQQIAQQAEDENKALTEQYDKLFTGAGIRVKGFVDTSADDAIKAFDRFYTHAADTLNGKTKLGESSENGESGIPRTPSSPAAFASGGWVDRGGYARVHAGEFMLSRGMLAGRSPIPSSVQRAISKERMSMRSLSINIYPTPNQSPVDIAKKVRAEMREILEELAA